MAASTLTETMLQRQALGFTQLYSCSMAEAHSNCTPTMGLSVAATLLPARLGPTAHTLQRAWVTLYLWDPASHCLESWN